MHDGAAAAFDALRRRGLKPRAPDRTFATPDHYVPTDTRRVAEIADARRRGLVETLARDSAEHGIRHFGLGGRAAGHRPHHRAGNGADAAGAAAGLRRQPHLDARRGGRARLRHRQHGGDACAGDADALAAQAEDAAHHRGRRAGRGRDGQGPDPRHHRAHRRGRRDRATSSSTPARRCARSRWRGGSRSATCRSRRAGAPAWWRRTTRPTPISPAANSRRRAPSGSARCAAGARCRPTRAPRSTARCRWTRPRWRRW